MECHVCTNKLRADIEGQLKIHSVPWVAHIFWSYFDEDPGPLRKLLERHKKYHMNSDKPQVKPKNSEKVTIDSLSKSLLELGEDMVTYWKKNPEDARKRLKMNDILKAQQVLIERQRVKQEGDALKLGMAKIFGGFLKKGEVIDGELVGERNLLPENQK